MGRKGKKYVKQKTPLTCTSRGTRLGEELSQEAFNNFVKTSQKLPPIFLHKPIDFECHVTKLLNLGVKFYKPSQTHLHIKIKCLSINDYKSMINYFNKKRLPYHTYGLPDNRKMKIVIKGLPAEIDELDIMSEIKFLSIPVIRVHRMKTTPKKERPALFLMVVPHDVYGWKALRIQTIFNYPVTLEKPRPAVEQCHRCQQWGHSQRNCHGEIKCVICSLHHFSKNCCQKKTDPPKCANCKGEHTANYRKCEFCPLSQEHKESQEMKKILPRRHQKELVTFYNLENLFTNYLPPSIDFNSLVL